MSSASPASSPTPAPSNRIVSAVCGVMSKCAVDEEVDDADADDDDDDCEYEEDDCEYSVDDDDDADVDAVLECTDVDAVTGRPRTTLVVVEDDAEVELTDVVALTVVSATARRCAGVSVMGVRAATARRCVQTRIRAGRE